MAPRRAALAQGRGTAPEAGRRAASPLGRASGGRRASGAGARRRAAGGRRDARGGLAAAGGALGSDEAIVGCFVEGGEKI